MFTSKTIFFFIGFLLILQIGNAQWNFDQNMSDHLDAVTFSPGQESMLLFSGTAFQYFSLVDKTNYEITALQSIHNFPTDWDYIQAAVNVGESEVLLFNGNKVIQFDALNGTVMTTFQWEGWPSEWQGQVDAAVQWDENQIIFFLADDYVIYNIQENKYNEPDLIINWEGWPNSWADGISAATNNGDGYIYFFRDSEYLVFDTEKGIFIGPMNISSNVASK